MGSGAIGAKTGTGAIGAIGAKGAIGPIGPMEPIGATLVNKGAATGNPIECKLGPVLVTTALKPLIGSAVYSTLRMLPSGSTRE